MAKIEELFSTKTILNYVKERQPVQMLGDVLFPENKIEDISFEMIKGSNNIPVAAYIHAFDSKTKLATRQPYGKSLAELALIKQQIKMGEKLIIMLNTPRTNVEEQQAIKLVYNDVDNMVTSVKTRIEAMRMELLSTGKITVAENGVNVTVDYNVPVEHTALTGFDWTQATAKPLDDIKTWSDKMVTDRGTKPVRALTSNTVLNLLLTNTSIRKAVFGTNSDRVLTKDMLNQLLTSMDLPSVEVYDARYKVQNDDGTFTTKRYFTEDRFVLLPDGYLGETVYGLTAEELELRQKGDVEVEDFGNIVAEIYKTNDPVARFTKAVATALPSFPVADDIFIAKVK